METAGWYKSQAIRALNKIKPDEAIKAVDRIKLWLNTEESAGSIGEEAYEYVALMIEGDFIETALSVLRELIRPRLTSNYEMIGNNRAAYEPVFNIYDLFIETEYQKVNVLDELTKKKP